MNGLQDADDDLTPTLISQEISADLDEEVQDFRFLSHLSQPTTSEAPTLPRRGAKDFEPHDTVSQTDALNSSRDAMHAALSHPRVQMPKSALIGIYDPLTGDVLVRSPRGPHFRTMGKGQAAGVHLLPEESLYLIGRGGLDLHWGDESGIPMGLQAAYAFLTGADGGRGVSMERFTVYAGLKRSGYIVQRGASWDPRLDGLDPSLAASKQNVNAQGQPLGLFARIYQGIFKACTTNPPAQGPLVGVGVYRNYSDIYRLLSIINAHDPSMTAGNAASKPLAPTSQPTLRPCFHVWKPCSNFKKSSPPPPDFQIAVVNAREDSFPSLEQMDGLLQSVPYEPPPAGMRSLYPRLKHGWRNVILAVVDQGIVSYIRVGDAAFGREKLYEQEGTRGGGGKRGGSSAKGRVQSSEQGMGRGMGRGRGRGRGRGK